MRLSRLFHPVRLLAATFSLALRRSMTHRTDFAFDIAQSLLGIATLLVTTLVVFQQTDELAGWSRPQTLVLIGIYAIIAGLRRTFIDPSLSTFVESIRNGTLDEVLLRPAPDWFTATCRDHAPLALGQSVAGLAVLFVGLTDIPVAPDPLQAAAAILLVGCALAMAWAFSLSVACLAFWAERLEFSPLTSALWDIGRYPADVYRRPISTMVTYVIPLAGMVTLPASALTRGHALSALATGVVISAVLVVGARVVFQSGLSRYTGATS